MVELITEIAIYLAIAALLGLFLGYLFWGWRMGRRLEAARAEGAARVRTSVDGDAALRSELSQRTRERDQLAKQIDQLMTRQSTRATQTAAPRDKARSADDDGRPRSGTNLRVVETEAKAAGADAGGGIVKIFAEEPAPKGAQPAAKAPSSEGAGDNMEASAAMLRGISGGNRAETPAPPTEAPLADADASAEATDVKAIVVPEDADDLKRIKGVGEAVEMTLNGLGIFYFDQIAALTAEEITWVEEALDGEPGRVMRDEWIEQSRRLLAEKLRKERDG